MIELGGIYRTPFEPSGLVKVIETGREFLGRGIVTVLFVEDHPHGYPRGWHGIYFADELVTVAALPPRR